MERKPDWLLGFPVQIYCNSEVKDMGGIDATKETFESVTVLDKPMLFTCARIDRDTVPKGMYLYEVRHDDDQRGDPV